MPFMKDKMKKKDEVNLEDMQEQINEAETQQEEVKPAAEEAVEESAETQEQAVDETEKLKAEIEEKKNQYLRLQADFENFRRRTRQEKEELGNVVTQTILKDMLPLLDNFERALASDNKDSEGFHKGVEMIYNQFAEALKKNGLEYIETEGKKFDPNFHQAVMRVQNPDLEDEIIAAELQKGYIVKGRVVRPSMVQVVSN
ncbi:nucleotide exchange factor GrpE [Schwartzia succinivorans]|jgi:molecular chaperone GrpE|uniref:Protein GrpE n=1 Tax=Schwartzia succinivorans DSM 10502 TaxID=1123243 RepID=A0A1M4T9H2_9FIRM|nr:nucleotide exchange factor GrpE [Schwartzia succinivorans]SHE41149.1 molecular chaperone GrpE [Schwartzia succinivorans DSM 10502]